MDAGELKKYKYKGWIIFQLIKFDASVTISISSMSKKKELYKKLKMDWSNR